MDNIEAIKKSRKLNNSLKFNFFLFLKENDVHDIFEEFKKQTKLQRVSSKKYKKHFQILLANLIYCEKERKYLALSFSKKYYIISDKYNPKKIRWDILYNIIKFLKRKKYIDVHIGYKKKNFSRLTRIKLSENFPKYHIKKEVKFDLKEYPFLILKDEKKEYIEYKNTPLIKRRIKVIEDFNNILAENYVTLGNKLISTYPIYRVFNNKSLKQGGRFYGGEFQRISKDNRRKLKINGRETVELDFSCLHINLLYDKENIRYKEDAYEIGYKREHSRKIIKFILITMLNSSSRKDATSAVRYQLNRTGSQKTINIDKAIDLLLEKHQKINKYFFNKKNGLELQYKESLVAEHIIKNFIYSKKPKVILPIHDGFICDARYENKLKRMMNQAYKKFIGGKNCKITKV